MAGYILALDQGTTSSRAILYDDHARPIKMVQQPTTLQTPRAGFVEQDAQQIWQTQISCAHDVINRAGLLATDVMLPKQRLHRMRRGLLADRSDG